MANTKTDQATRVDMEQTIERTRAEMRENLTAQFARDAMTVAADGGMDVTEEMQRMGRPMTPHDLERKLLKCNGRFRFQVSIQDARKKGIYMLMDAPQVNGKYKSDLRFICGYENRLMPEYSIIVPVSKDLPDLDNPQLVKVQTMDEEIRGWRTVIASCLIAGVIEPSDVVKHFPIEEGKSEHWHDRINPDIEVTNGDFIGPQHFRRTAGEGFADGRIDATPETVDSGTGGGTSTESPRQAAN